MNKNRKLKVLNMRSQVRTLSIKCYDEQLPDGWEAIKQNIKVIDKSKWQVIAICHDRDTVTDDIWLPAIEKAHYHIIVRILNDKKTRVEHVLGTLGVVYRPVEDKNLWENHGVESCRDFASMAVYETHETEEAILEGKEQYDLEELVSNLTIEEIKQIREGYIRVNDSGEKVTPRVLASLDKEAYELGVKLGDFDKWYGALSFAVRSQAKMRTIRESYYRGASETLMDERFVPRLCVFVRGLSGIGKSYAVRHALKALGKRYLNVSGGGAGKFDKLTAQHDAIVIDDDTCPNLLNMSDAKETPAYKRGSNNPPWIGDYLIVTYNDSFDAWLDECGIKSKRQREALEKRFYVCDIRQVCGRNVIVCTSMEERTNEEVRREIYAKYKSFVALCNESLSQHNPDEVSVDRSDINEEYDELLAREEEEKRAKAKEEEEAKARAKEEEARKMEEAMRAHEELSSLLKGAKTSREKNALVTRWLVSYKPPEGEEPSDDEIDDIFSINN